MADRITRDQLYMGMADLLALRSTCLRGHVGALIVIDRRPAGGGYNGAPAGQPECLDVGCETLGDMEGCQRTIHAELNAIAWAARHGVQTLGATMYCTHAPCKSCAQAIVAAQFNELVYKKDYRAARLDILEQGNVEVRRWTSSSAS